MPIVSQRVNLSHWGPGFSDLDIDGIPQRYDTAGQLGSIEDSSTLNLDGIPDKYDTRGILGNLPPEASNLDLDSTPDRYNTQGQLGTLPPEASNLNFDGSLPAGSDAFPNSQANGFTIQAPIGVTQFIDPGNSSIYGFTGNTAPTVDFFLGPNPSQGQETLTSLGFPGTLPGGNDTFPNVYANGFTVQAPIGVTQFIDPGNSSQFGFTGNFPAGADAFANIHANGFTIQAPIGVTQFTDPGNSSIYGFQGALPPGTDAFPNSQANGFTIQAPIGVTQFIDPGNSSIYGFTGNLPPNVDFFSGPNPSQGQEVLTALGFPGTLPGGNDTFPNVNANGFTIQAPIGVTQFIDPGNSSIYGFQGALPPGTDAFPNSQANGFTIQAPIGVTQFIDPGNSSIYGFQGALPGPVDFITNNNAGGFTIKNPVGISQFILNGQTSIYGLPNGSQDTGPLGGSTQNSFVDTNARGFTIKNPVGVSQFVDDGQTSIYGLTGRRAGTDVFANLDANGFTLRNGYLQTNFVNINANTYTPNPSSTITTVTLGPHVPGIATLDNQLGQGSSKFKNTGFSTSKRYYDTVRNDENKSLLASWATKRNSDSALDIAYSYSSYYGHNLKLRDTAFNPTYIAHPLILRGLQSADRRPQRWGIDALGQQEGRTAANNLAAALDGGFIRGGAMTALERSAIDTARIAKFMASPKGIVWAITQVGLGKSNPRVEKNPLNTLPFNDTRSHSGLTTLLSVPGSAFGLHFTRHGIPFANEAASYSQVHRALRNANDKGENTRLWKLKSELFGAGAYNSVPNPNNPLSIGGGGKKVNPSENPVIEELSGPGGPNSVYGIGSTTILRYDNTINAIRPLQDKKEFGPASAQSEKFNSVAPDVNDRYGIYNQYAPFLNNNRTEQGTGQDDKSQNLGDTTDTSGQIFTDDNGTAIGLAYQLKNKTTDDYVPGYTGLKQNVATPYLNETKNEGEIGSRQTKYAALSYRQLAGSATSRRSQTNAITDFRFGIGDNVDTKTFSTDPGGETVLYDSNNLTDKFGFGKHGHVGRDRSNPDSDTFKDTLTNLRDENNKNSAYSLATSKDFAGDKINAIDYISGEYASKQKIDPNNLYEKAGIQDFVKFYFSGLEFQPGVPDDVIIFRATMKGISDSFAPSWNQIQVMGRPDGPSLYSSFEHTISFGFTVAATSREELIPMWRKLNYLTTYTMPVYGTSGKPGGPIIRLTLGDMYTLTPGFITTLTVNVNDEATWDLALDASSRYSKQLPNIVDVDVSFKIIHDWRPQKGGRNYTLYNNAYGNKFAPDSWLWDTNHKGDNDLPGADQTAEERSQASTPTNTQNPPDPSQTPYSPERI